MNYQETKYVWSVWFALGEDGKIGQPVTFVAETSAKALMSATHYAHDRWDSGFTRWAVHKLERGPEVSNSQEWKPNE